MFAFIAATDAEKVIPRRGDELIAPADVVMDRAFTLPAPPLQVWPWLAQLGKRRAGWYLPAGLERFLPAAKRAAWEVHDRWQHLHVGDGTRVFLRLRMAPVRHRWLAETAGELIDILTIAAMATGLRQRLSARSI